MLLISRRQTRFTAAFRFGKFDRRDEQDHCLKQDGDLVTESFVDFASCVSQLQKIYFLLVDIFFSFCIHSFLYPFNAVLGKQKRNILVFLHFPRQDLNIFIYTIYIGRTVVLTFVVIYTRFRPLCALAFFRISLYA